MNLSDHIIEWVVGLVILGIVVLFGVAAYHEAKAERFSLRKDSWACTAKVQESITSFIQSGSMLIPITTYTDRCTQWSAK